MWRKSWQNRPVAPGIGCLPAKLAQQNLPANVSVMVAILFLTHTFG
jgi:hypothetical protein